jgi:hypothetical protein
MPEFRGLSDTENKAAGALRLPLYFEMGLVIKF